MEIDEAIDFLIEKGDIANQSQLSDMLGVTQPTISNYYKKNIIIPLEKARIIYMIYGIQVEPYTVKALKNDGLY